MKILHLITGLTIGGAEHMLLRTVPRLTGEQIVCSIIARQAVGEQLERLGVRVIYLNLKSYFDIRAIWRLWRLLRQERPDILTTYLLHADIVGRILGRLAGVPIIISSLRCAHKDKPQLVKLAKYTAGLANHYFAVSQAVADWAHERLAIAAERITVVHNGLDLPDNTAALPLDTLRSQFHITPESVVISYIGRFDPQKGLEYLLTACAILAAPLQQHLIVLMVGDGPSRVSLEQQAQHIGLIDQIHFLGFRQDVNALLSVTDIFISPTMFEGISNAIMEAMAASKAVITTNIPENRELITSGINGILVPVCSSTDLAQQLEYLMTRPALRRQLGEAAHQTIEQNFSLDRTVTQLNDLYQRFYVRHRR